jgi:ubiquinone/menaquinone biosynthesis C-methylase UbiE/DNA-binding MarR family transcriptional regulator
MGLPCDRGLKASCSTQHIKICLYCETTAIHLMTTITSAQLLLGLKAAGECTRLRLLALLDRGEFNVKDLTQILGQSQPRLSRHLKLLTEAHLIERFQEGSSVFYAISREGIGAVMARRMLELLDPQDASLGRDLGRAAAVRRERAEAALAYFDKYAPEWDTIRSLHVYEAQVEAAMLAALGPGPFDLLLDLGAGAGRILELFAPFTKRGLGFDISRDMLACARAKLEAAGISHCQARLGDIFNLAVEDDAADAVIIHQVLHFLEEPAKAILEAGRVLKPGGRLLIVDFAPHGIELLRESFAHRRLGFERYQVEGWLRQAGLDATGYEELRPEPGASEKLTVSLWLAARPQPPAASAEQGF